MSAAERGGEQEKNILRVSVCLQIINSPWGAPELFHLLFAKFRLGRFSGASAVRERQSHPGLQQITEEEFGQATGKLFPRLGGIQSGQKQSWPLNTFIKVRRIDVYSQESKERKKLSTPLFAANNFTFSSHMVYSKKPCSFLFNIT